LLPLSGRTAAAGKAIQNGFMGAYFSTVAGLDDPQTVRIYDVSNEGGASAAYATAVADGAEFVIGPLLKNNVVALANDILVPVPVLTLNYLPDNTLAPPGLYQFALAPEDEARSAAVRALADGHTRAVALVPNNDWGRRVLTSFSTEFEALGGTLLDYRSYTPGNPDYSNTIEDLLLEHDRRPNGLVGKRPKISAITSEYWWSFAIRSTTPPRQRVYIPGCRRTCRPLVEVAAQVSLLRRSTGVFNIVDIRNGWPIQFRP